jgi:hypothetical protein
MLLPVLRPGGHMVSVFDVIPWWLIVFVLLANIIPAAKILRRTGHNPAWCVLFFFPLINLFMFWFFAFKPWPIDKQMAGQ